MNNQAQVKGIVEEVRLNRIYLRGKADYETLFAFTNPSRCKILSSPVSIQGKELRQLYSSKPVPSSARSLFQS